MQDPIPDWTTHLALVSNGKVLTGTKEEILATQELRQAKEDRAISVAFSTASAKRTEGEGKPVAVLRNVNVSYGERKVRRRHIHLAGLASPFRHRYSNRSTGPFAKASVGTSKVQTVRTLLTPPHVPLERGPGTGSGKTTLLSLLTGDHPQSYTQRGVSHLELFAHPRPRIPTPHLRALIGVVSPELANAYPRHAQTTVWDVVGTGFDGAFVPGGQSGVGRGIDGTLTDDVRRWRIERVREVLVGLGPRAWADADAGKDEERKHALADVNEAFARRAFVDLSPGEQNMVLLMRALVGRPQLVLLDEVWAGMDDHMICAAKSYLREGGVGRDPAIVVVSHWEGEVPWTRDDGLYIFRLQDGIGMQI